MKVGSFDFSLRELAGSLGDWGTMLPLTVGYITVCRLNPAGLLVTLGIANIATGLIFRLPLPIQPMKVIAIVAIAQGWTGEKVYTAGLVMGFVWLTMGLTGAMDRVARLTPQSVIRGIHLSLAALLAFEGFRMVSTWWLVGAGSLVVILLLRANRYAPASVVLILGGIVIMGLQGELGRIGGVWLSLPPLTLPDASQIWPVLRDAGLAQIPLTATNSVIATSALISLYWPTRRVSNRRLASSVGVMNIALPLLGGMPLCHGAGGLAGQYFFGARTGGTNIIEGTIWIALGLLLAGSIASLFAAFPLAIVGAMMLLVGVGMVSFAREVRFNRHLIPTAATLAVSLLANMAVGFAAGMAAHYIFTRTKRHQADRP